jgi:hypothetical protein
VEWDVPADEATSEQRAQVEALKAELEGDFAAAGLPTNLDRIPVVVADLGDRYVGACYKDDEGRPLVIALHPRALSFQVPSGYLTLAYITLLHEVGHCYFNRVHEEDVISQAGTMAKLKVANGEEAISERKFLRLRASVMNDTNHEAIPEGLRQYYVAEILGQARAHDWQGLAAFAALEVETFQDAP